LVAFWRFRGDQVWTVSSYAIQSRDGIYQLFPALRVEAYNALRTDISKRGVLVPVELDESGNILDGHNRATIAAELGIRYPTITRTFASEEDKREHILKINLLRRHLGEIGWAEAFTKLAEVRGVKLGETHNRHTPRAATVAALAAEVGISDRTARYRLDVATKLADDPDLAEKVDSGEMPAKRAFRVARERQAEKQQEQAPPLILPPTIDLRSGDFREVLADVPDGSVDLIFTDPPYPAKYLPLWSDLAALAARVLRPSSLLVAYSGQYHLPDVMAALAEHLEYIWLGALWTPGPANQVQQRHIRSTVKPLLFYARKPYKPGPWFEDSYQSEGRVKDSHDWQQSIGAAQSYIDRLTKAGDVVLDPFLGSGTTAEACMKLRRSFIGAEIKATTLHAAQGRLTTCLIESGTVSET
jgi:site-specific DNA-methyltransferase (adenine-specific)